MINRSITQIQLSRDIQVILQFLSPNKCYETNLFFFTIIMQTFQQQISLLKALSFYLLWSTEKINKTEP